MTQPIHIPNQAFVSPPELVDELKPLGHEITAVRGTILFHEGDPAKGVYIVLQGHASLTMSTENGNTVLARSSGPGSLLGLPGTFLRGIYQLTAEIDEDSRLIFVEREKVLEFLRQRTDLCMIVLSVLGNEVSQMPIQPVQPKRRASRKQQQAARLA
ncbi:cyclic nucleotide-binding protein [Candidatus Koribacter versatilis Ellin345]|uniref:Cyclic nucleotide-binding protein n=1 Tax=Koribacter versatilis (strain Ellin345) TaxID=204669 RepID=Q1IIV5_KORVE|nr:Crp/Fnr family transcriptional regulator [Candidatus Koribacter versatilis]ABF43195.1 cyclic nucleotide-binding protein [Candidatus Koribacter versatilis Ellin345]